MITKLAIATVCTGLLLAGCAAPIQKEAAQTTWHLQPPLSPGMVMQICVQDCRPVVERESTPSTDYVYTGSLFSVDDSAKTIATDLGNMVTRHGGGREVQFLITEPSKGLAITFKLEHWYAKTPRNQTTSPIVARGEFAGTLTLLRDGQILATKQILAAGNPCVIDIGTAFPGQKSDTAGLITAGMEKAANTSQQKGYALTMDFLEETWHLLQ
jgi:hypothetical protein